MRRFVIRCVLLLSLLTLFLSRFLIDLTLVGSFGVKCLGRFTLLLRKFMSRRLLILLMNDRPFIRSYDRQKSCNSHRVLQHIHCNTVINLVFNVSSISQTLWVFQIWVLFNVVMKVLKRDNLNHIMNRNKLLK